MFKKLVNLAGSIFNSKPEPESPKTEQEYSPSSQPSTGAVEAQPQAVQCSSAPLSKDILQSASGTIEPEDISSGSISSGSVSSRSISSGSVSSQNISSQNIPSGNISPPENISPGNISPGNISLPENISPEKRVSDGQVPKNRTIAQDMGAELTTLTLAELYSSTDLSDGMLYIAHKIGRYSANTYVQSMHEWSQAQDFTSTAAIAIAAKRQGNYPKALRMFDEFAQSCPHFYQIHHSAMKILAASGDIAAAFRALQLWCVATIPEKALRLNRYDGYTALDKKLDEKLDITLETISTEQLSYLAGWAIAESKSMYHLGSLQMILTNELDLDASDAYLSTLQGQKKQTLHDPTLAIAQGKAIAQTLPWHCLTPVLNTEIWQQLFNLSAQKATLIAQRREAA